MTASIPIHGDSSWHAARPQVLPSPRKIALDPVALPWPTFAHSRTGVVMLGHGGERVTYDPKTISTGPHVNVHPLASL